VVKAWKVPKATGGLQRRRRLPARKGNETVQETLARLAPLLRQVTEAHSARRER
jgi:hypothetical protein